MRFRAGGASSARTPSDVYGCVARAGGKFSPGIAMSMFPVTLG